MATSGNGNEVKFRVSVDTGQSPQELRELEKGIDAVGKEADSLEKSGTKAAAATNKIGDSASQAGALLKNLGATLAAGFTFDALVQAAAKLEGVRTGLQAVTGDVGKTNEQLAFIRETANRVGADIGDVGQAFLGLAAATRGTAVEGEPTRQVFEAVASAMAKAGKSSAETQNALTALAQIAGKGTVSMEELRGQLGEALPGALQAAANGLGITTQDLIQLVETGQLAAEDLFPALSKGLNDLYGGGTAGAQTLTQEIQNIKNAFIELASNIGEAGGLDALKTGAEIAQTALVLLDDSLVTIGSTLGVVAAAVTSLDFSGLPAAFDEIERTSREKLLKAAQHNQTLATYIEATGNEATKAALKQQQAAEKTKTAGAEAQKASDSYAKLAIAYGKVGKEVEQQIEAAEKSRIAREAEGKAAVALAQAFGTEAEQRQASIEAAQEDAKALTEVALARQKEVALLKQELTEKKAYLAQSGQESDQRKKEIAELEKKIELRTSEADKATAQAKAGRLAAEAARAEAEATADNSKRVVELADAYREAANELERVQTLRAQGKATAEQLEAAELALGRAATLYRDALSDQVKAIEAGNKAKQANLQLERAGLEAQLAGLRSLEATAKALGDEELRRYALIEAKKIEIKLAELKAKAMEIEADGQIAVARATLAELEAKGELTATKRTEIETSIQLAEVKREEARAIRESIGIMDVELRALQNGKLAKEDETDAIDENTASLERNTAARAKSNNERARENQLAYDADGFRVNADGSRFEAAVTDDNFVPTGLPNGQFNTNRLTQGQIKKMIAEGKSLDGYGAEIRGPGLSNAAFGGAGRGGERMGGGSGGAGGASPGGSTTVNINLNGRRRSINVASRSDASALEALLRELEEDGGRAG